MSPSFNVPRGLVRHDTVTVDLTGCSRPPQPAVLNRCDIATLDHARAFHMRHALEAAVEHGTALLAALGLPRLVTADFVPMEREQAIAALDAAIVMLDTCDAASEDLEDDDDLETVGDDEEDLGWTACTSQVDLGDNTDDREETALERHGMGFVRSGPDDAEDGHDAERDDSDGAGQYDEPPCVCAGVVRDLAPQVVHV